ADGAAELAEGSEAGGVAFRIGSAQGFLDFLEANYQRSGETFSDQRCDTGAQVAFTYSCDFPCPPGPGADCEDTVNITKTVTCFNSPPCPSSGKTYCAPRPDRIVITGIPNWPCFCSK